MGHPNGKMKPKEVREMVEKTMPKSDAAKMEKHVFRIYDSNNDGYIDFVEFMLIFHIISDGEFWWSPPCFFWAYLYCSLVGWNMGVDPLEWGGATCLGRRTLLELSRWEIITKYFPYSIHPSLVKLDNLKKCFY